MKHSAPAVIMAIGIFLVWQLVAMVINAPYILPTPLQILEKIWVLKENLFFVQLPATLQVTGIGLGISIVLGLALAMAMDRFPALERALYPVVVATQTIPTTAIAPLFVLWFGYSIWSKVLVTILITFFPITITVFDGLKSTKREMEELLTSYGASPWDIFWKLKLPTALPFLFCHQNGYPVKRHWRCHCGVVGCTGRSWLFQ